MRISLLSIITVLFLLSSCKGNESKDQKSNDTSETTTNTEEATTKTSTESASTESGEAICLLDRLSIRDMPTKKGKWLASMSLGEKVTFTGEKALDTVSKKEFYKVKLVDGKEGWTRADFIVVNGKVGVLLEDATVYKRPDLLTKTDKKYSPMDIIAIVTTQGDWIQVKGKRAEGKYIEENWIKSSNISSSPVDIATAKFATSAMSKETMTERIKALKEIISNSDLSSSGFTPILKEKIKDLEEKNELKESLDSKKKEAESAVEE